MLNPWVGMVCTREGDANKRGLSLLDIKKTKKITQAGQGITEPVLAVPFGMASNMCIG